MTAHPPRVGLYGYFGMGNIGNEASLAAFLAFVRGSHPHVSLQCFVAGPDVVAREHGVPAVQLMSYRTSGGGALVGCMKLLSRIWDIPRTYFMMKDVDVLVVPGTGVLERKLVAKPWGLPYWLFLAVLSCRLRRRTVALVSVGAAYATHPVTRWLYRATVNMSDYCSFRDAESREAAAAMGVRSRRLGPVTPDLAFALATPAVRSARSGHVVMGVMAYEGDPEDPGRGPQVVRRYVERMVDVGTSLLDEGRSLTFTVGDVADLGLAEEIATRICTARPGRLATQVGVSTATTFEDLMAEMAAAEVAVVSRFHNLIAALKSGTPAVSLSYADKNDHLLRQFGLEGACQQIDSFDVARLRSEMEVASRDAEWFGERTSATLDTFHEVLHRQFVDLSSCFFDTVTDQAVGNGVKL